MDIKKEKYFTNVRPEMLSLIPLSANKTLEIGCGQGNFSAQLTKRGVETWGVEPNHSSAKIAQTQLFKILEGTLAEKLDELPHNYFDAIIMNDILEHLLFPWEDMKLLKTKLKNDGVLVSSIPNVRYAKNLFHLLFMKDWKYKNAGILDITHFRFFTKKSIIAMHKKSGYTVQKIKGINVTKSVLFFPFALLVNIITLFTQTDIFYMQFATIAKKND